VGSASFWYAAAIAWKLCDAAGLTPLSSFAEPKRLRRASRQSRAAVLLDSCLGYPRTIFVLISDLLYHPRRLVNFYLVRFWSPRRSGVTLATTHKAGFFDPGGWHFCLK
jgi:hypothetical protein